MPENKKPPKVGSKRKVQNKIVFRLYIAGTTPRSARAIMNLKRLCEKHLAGRYSLAIIDVYQQPELAIREQIVAAPTLIRHLPPPVRKVIGDLSNEKEVWIGLGLDEPIAT